MCTHMYVKIVTKDKYKEEVGEMGDIAVGREKV